VDGAPSYELRRFARSWNRWTWYRTALNRAARPDDSKSMQLLVLNDADVGATDEEGKLPLYNTQQGSPVRHAPYAIRYFVRLRANSAESRLPLGHRHVACNM
jgi:hypothetical protein